MRKGPFCRHEGKTCEDYSEGPKHVCGCTHMHRGFTQEKPLMTEDLSSVLAWNF